MATEDITRSAFYPAKHYDSVRMQQGRVLTDDDYNETEVIDHEDRRRHRIDIIGPAGTSDDGFRISAPSYTSGKIDFTLAKGSMYVGGLRVELEADEKYGKQGDYLHQPISERAWSGTFDQRNLVYLEVWQQPVSAVEDGELFETALGGPDTAVRIRTMYRVHRFHVDTDDCTEAWKLLADSFDAQKLGTLDPATGELVPSLKMKVDFTTTNDVGDLCSPAVVAGYLGANNSAIRVALVPKNAGSGADGALVWGFDNASALYRVKIAHLDVGNPEVEFQTLPRDVAHWPLQGQTVEILPWSAVLPNGEVVSELAGQLAVVQTSYNDSSKSITLSSPLDAALGEPTWIPPSLDAKKYLFLRVWDRSPDHASPTKLEYVLGTPVALGDTGIEVTVTSSSGAAPGASVGADAYWIIAARPEVPDKIVPWELFDGRAPEGVRRFYAPLGIIHWKASSPGLSTVHDCRPTFRPLTRIKSCCSYVVGDGTTSFGDFTSIQAAIDNLPPSGGKICVLDGVYAEHIVISELIDVVIEGCGDGAVLMPKDAGMPVITIKDDSHRITIRTLTVTATDSHAIVIAKSGEVTLCDLAITTRDQCAVLASDGENYHFFRNRIQAIPLVADVSTSSDDGRWPAVFVVRTVGLRIVDNEIITNVPAGLSLLRVPRGGLQIGGACEDVEVRHNRITAGNGNGITLGSVSWSFDGVIWVPGDILIWIDDCLGIDWGGSPPIGGISTEIHSDGELSNVLIVDNDITGMAGDGIGVARFFNRIEMDSRHDTMISVRRLTIDSNRIIGCLQAEFTFPESLLGLAGHGGVALANVDLLLLRDNVIELNGRDHVDPVCGVYILQGTALSIENNRIAHNGPRKESTATPKPGSRGGVFINQAWMEPDLGSGGLHEGTPSVRVHDNVVICSEGRALYISGSGSMSIQDNQLLTKGHGTGSILEVFLAEDRAETLYGSAVEIFNAGLSVDDGRDVTGASGLTTIKKSSARTSDFADGSGIDTLVSEDAALIGGDVLFNDNQVTLDLTDPYPSSLFSSVAITSYDDVSMVGNQLWSHGDFLNTNAYVVGHSVRVNSNRFKEGSAGATYSALTYGKMNTTTDNQGTHCIIPIAATSAHLADFHNLVMYSTPCSSAYTTVKDFFTSLGLTS